jgi:hypothetical protein
MALFRVGPTFRSSMLPYLPRRRELGPRADFLALQPATPSGIHGREQIAGVA